MNQKLRELQFGGFRLNTEAYELRGVPSSYLEIMVNINEAVLNLARQAIRRGQSLFDA